MYEVVGSVLSMIVANTLRRMGRGIILGVFVGDNSQWVSVSGSYGDLVLMGDGYQSWGVLYLRKESGTHQS